MAVVSLVEVQDLGCERGGRRIFRNLSFAVASGQTLSLEGPNGAGKTSVLRILSGLLPPLEGDVRVHMAAGYEVGDPEERGRLAGWIGHHDGVKGQLTVAENAQFFATLHGARMSVSSVLDRVGLSRIADLPAQYLSAGQRRRLGLARLILSARPLWLLDEPLSSLDAAGRRLTAELIGQHCDDGGIAIVATHETLGLDATRFFLGDGMNAFRALLMRDMKLAFRAGGGATLAAAFFALIATLVPFGVGSEQLLLGRIAGGVLWVSAALAALLSLDRLFQADYEDGSLDVLVLSPLSLELAATAKILAHWFTTGLPLVLLSPLLGLLLNLPVPGYLPLFLSLLIGTPALSAVGAIGAALTISIRRGGLILALIVLPLLTPTLIFGAGAVSLAIDGEQTGAFYLLAAFSVAAVALSPFAAAASVRLNIAG